MRNVWHPGVDPPRGRRYMASTTTRTRHRSAGALASFSFLGGSRSSRSATMSHPCPARARWWDRPMRRRVLLTEAPVHSQLHLVSEELSGGRCLPERAALRFRGGRGGGRGCAGVRGGAVRGWGGARPCSSRGCGRRVVAAPRARGCGEWRDAKRVAERARRQPRPCGAWQAAARLVLEDGRRTAGPVCDRPGLFWSARPVVSVRPGRAVGCYGPWPDDEPESLILAQSERWRHA
jgi:hypothetical protein